MVTIWYVREIARADRSRSRRQLPSFVRGKHLVVGIRAHRRRNRRKRDPFTTRRRPSRTDDAAPREVVVTMGHQ
ncbi:hypothetical protein DBV15_11254 [Temnothorax longispinosus]|uniref:Uncharacterized protein n=1 Tax=Temnothorax longispinosus TaxID=300112 RepID=A0A4V3SCU2_9HYME|nr:hypothetical protein DBV15_11254 [Temnothorax longispinosus]